VIFLLLVVLILGASLVAYSLSPYYGVLGLVVVSVAVSSFVGLFGMSFLGLVVLIGYLGGMLVVFAYSNALSADQFPIVGEIKEVLVVFGLSLFWYLFSFSPLVSRYTLKFLVSERGDWGLSGAIYYLFPVVLVLVGLALLVALVLVLVISFGASKGGLRALRC